jgi:hypothetical protein
MRWLFSDPKNAQECRQRQQVLERVDHWWRSFSRQQAAIVKSFQQPHGTFDVPRWMQEHLQAIDERLCWEFGPATTGHGHRLVITPECEHWLRPVVRTIIERAPSIEGWEFFPYRLAEDAEQAIATVEGASGRTSPARPSRLASVTAARSISVSISRPSFLPRTRKPAVPRSSLPNRS